MSRAVAFSAFGEPEVLHTIEVSPPPPGPGEVRVRMRAAGVQPADVQLRRGWTPPGFEVRFPQVLGNELAGIVDTIGADVTEFAEGDAVLGFQPLACYAELVVLPADQLVLKPPSMPWEVAGALSASGQTASIALEQVGVAPGDTVLIHAAAGGVGTIAVQLARARGARVIGTVSDANRDYVRALGATPVAYGDGLAARVRALAPEGVDAALDAVGGGALRASVELVPDRSRVGTIVDYPLAAELGAHAIRGARSADRLAELTALSAADRLHIHIRATYPLDRAADAHRDVERGHGRGKVVLVLP